MPLCVYVFRNEQCKTRYDFASIDLVVVDFYYIKCNILLVFSDNF